MAREPIIDCDVHHMIAEPEELFPYLPRDYVEHIQDFGLMMPGGFSTGYTNMPKGGARADVWDGDIHPANNIDMARKRHLDEYGVAAAVLTGSTVYGASVHPNVDYAAALCRAFNDWTLDTWIAADRRFFGSISVSAVDPYQAAQEIHRLGKHPRMVQVIIPAGARMPFGNRFYHPIYEAAQEYCLPVCIHFGSEGTGVSGPPTGVGYPSYYLEMRMARPQNAMAHVSSLICEGVFEKFPTFVSSSWSTTPSGCRGSCGTWTRTGSRLGSTRPGSSGRPASTSAATSDSGPSRWNSLPAWRT